MPTRPQDSRYKDSAVKHKKINGKGKIKETKSTAEAFAKISKAQIFLSGFADCKPEI